MKNLEQFFKDHKESFLRITYSETGFTFFTDDPKKFRVVLMGSGKIHCGAIAPTLKDALDSLEYEIEIKQRNANDKS